MPLPKDPIRLELWRERQRIAQSGRKQPQSQIDKRKATRLLNHPKVLIPCANCGKRTYHIPSRRKEHNFCSSRCHAVYQYKNGLKDTKRITEKAHETTRLLVEKGEHPFQKPENHIKAMRELGRRNYGKTWIEEKMGWALAKLGIKFESQFPIKYGLDILGRDRYYFPDFALLDNHILVECDGKQWHKSKSKDVIRQFRLEELGWRVMRFPEGDIKNNVMDCAYKVQSFLPIV